MECKYTPAESSNWLKRGQYQIRDRWNGVTHFLRVQIGRHEVSQISNRLNCITHYLSIQIVRNQVSIKSVGIECFYKPAESLN
jgi:hypothetical protein